jgi:uncharacterized protein (UPF0261 family)
MGIPQVVAPGAIDIRLHGKPEDLPEELRRRPYTQHTPTHTHVRTTAAELDAVGRTIAERLNAGTGPRAALVPTLGFSMFNRPGQVLYDEAANRAYVDALRETLAPEVELIEVEAHINDRAFADAIVDTFLRLRTRIG